MKRLFKPLSAILIVLYSIVQLLSLSLRHKQDLKTPERMIVVLAAPAQRAAEGLFDWVGDIWNSYIALVRTSERNRHLEKEVDRQRRQLSELEELRGENERLRTLLHLSIPEKHRMLVARRVASGASPYEWTLRVNRGSRDGVELGLAVVSDRGLVGQVLEVTSSTSDVLLLADRASAVDVISQRSRARGILRGEAFSELRFEYVPKNEDLKVNDEVITSGLDRVYPKGIPVGTISQVERDKEGMFLTATVSPAVDFSRLEEVAILLPENP